MNKEKIIDEILYWQRKNSYNRKELRELSIIILKDILKDEEIEYTQTHLEKHPKGDSIS